jgi:hypothetical protein
MLHLEMGVVNVSWDEFELWFDNDIEIIPPHEQDTFHKALEAAQLLTLPQPKNEAE